MKAAPHRLLSAAPSHARLGSKTINSGGLQSSLMAKAGALRISKEAEDFLACNPSTRRLARAAVEEYVRELRRLDELTSTSTMTEAKAIELGRHARKRIYRRMVER